MAAATGRTFGACLILLAGTAGAATLPPAGSPEAASQRYFSALKKRIAANPQLASVNRSEAAATAIGRDALTPWQTAWMTSKVDGFAQTLAPRATTPAWAQLLATPVREKGGIGEFKLTFANAVDARAEAAGYLAQFKRIDDFRLEVDEIRLDGPRALLNTRFDLRGELQNGARRNDRGQFAILAVKTGETWKLQSIQVVSAERLQSALDRKPTFEATTVAGLDTLPVVDRREAIRRGGYAIAAGDYDNDGRADLLLGNWGSVKLMHNTGKGFEDATLSAGLKGETLVKAAAFVDLDGDGQRDLIMLRFVPSGADSVGDFVAYRNLGNGKFELKEGVLPRSRTYDRAMPLTLADFDGNGTVDIYVGFPGARDFTNNLAQAKRKQGVYSQGVWFNDGAWKFHESPATSAILSARDTYPHSAIATDLDQDGQVDIIVVDDSGRVNPVYRNVGRGEFMDVTTRLGLAAPGWSMGLSTGDYDGDGKLDIITTNVSFHAARRIAREAEGTVNAKSAVGQTLAAVRASHVGALLYHNLGDGRFEEVAAKAGVADVGDGAGGAEWIDYNGDGNLDLYVPNGLWSANSKETLDSEFVRGVVMSPAFSQESDVVGRSVFQASPGFNPMLTALRSYKTATGEDGMSLGGHQRHRLFRNNGDATFTEVGYLEGADRTEDGYIASAVDEDGDGRLDLVLRNTDPAPHVNSAPVVVLRNTGVGQHNLLVQLKGHANIDGFGATVTASVAGRQIFREIRATNGATQDEPVASIGLGVLNLATNVRVRWPSGLVEDFGPQHEGRVVLQEGKGTTLSASR